MPNYILTNSSTILCPHGGIVTHVPGNIGLYRVNGEIPMLLTDQYLINGCPFMLPMGLQNAPMPCLRVQWLTGSMFLFVRGVPALTSASSGICQSQGPSGPPVIASFQTVVAEPQTITRVD